MADEPHDSHAPLEHADVRFEPTDIHLRGVLLVIFVFAGIILLLCFLAAALFQRERRVGPLPTEAGFRDVHRGDALPSEPRLEQVDRLAGIRTPDVYRIELSKEKILTSYGPTADKEFVHVPIDWALQQAAEQIPWRAEKKPQGPTRDRGLLDAGEPNSGRVFRGGSSP